MAKANSDRGGRGRNRRSDPGSVAPSSLVAAVTKSFRQDGSLAESTLIPFSDAWRRFASFVERGLSIADADAVQGADIRAFVDAPRSGGGRLTEGTRYQRRVAVRALYRRGRALGLVHIDPTVDVVVAPPKHPATRPLTDDEVDLCRIWAIRSLTDVRLPVVWALSECTARIAELPFVTVGDVDLGGRRVYIAGSARTLPRWAPMTDWAAARLERRLDAWDLPSEPEAPLVSWKVRQIRRPANAATMAVIAVLRSAGIHGEPDVRPSSVTAWAGARMLAEGASIEEVARALGMRSLDRAAEMIGHDWRAEP